MNTAFIRFLCPRCRARIKAPIPLIGQKRDCPGCSHPITVPHVPPQDSGPVLVLLEREDRLSLGVTYRTQPELSRLR